MKLRIRNWEKFQHYKFRKPPWIKLYREILDDSDWHKLSGESAKGLIMLWLIASEEDGYLPASDVLAFRLRISENRVIALLSDCSIWFEGGASTMLASCYQDAIPETETETETEKAFPPAKPAGVRSAQEFSVFWEAYPKKLGKQEANKAWKKHQCEGRLQEILASLKAWREIEWKERQFIPYPATWLNAGRWKETPQKANGNSQPTLEEQLKILEAANGQGSKSHAN